MVNCSLSNSTGCITPGQLVIETFSQLSGYHIHHIFFNKWLMIVMMLIKPSSCLIATWRETSQPETYKFKPKIYPNWEEGGFQDIPSTPLLESSSTALVSSLVKVGFPLAIWIPSPDGAGEKKFTRACGQMGVVGGSVLVFWTFSVAFGGSGFGSAKNDTENNGNFVIIFDEWSVISFRWMIDNQMAPSCIPNLLFVVSHLLKKLLQPAILISIWDGKCQHIFAH